MKIESPLELCLCDDRPPSSTDRVHFVFPFPGKFQAFCLLVRLNTRINVPMDGAKLKLAQVILSEGDIAWYHEVDVILIPLLHLYDTPCAKVRIAHWVLLPLCLRTPRAYGFAAVRRNVANALVNWVLCCWSMRYSLAVASKASPRCWRASTL